MTTDWHRALLASLLLSLAGCNDGGIVGTGTGDNADTPQIAGDTAAPAVAESAGTASFPLDSKDQQAFCARLPLDIAAQLGGSKTSVPATWKEEGPRAFSCRWEVPTNTGVTQVIVEVNGDPAFGAMLVSNSEGRYSAASTSVLNSGYKIIDDPCLHGIVIPAGETLWVTVSRENQAACAAGTDRVTTIETLNSAGEVVLSTLGSTP